MNEGIRTSFLIFILSISITNCRQVCKFDPENHPYELIVSSEKCAKTEFQLMFPKFEPVRFKIQILNSSCVPDRDVITHIDFNGCRIANAHAVYTGTTRRLEIFKQVGVGEEVASTVYNRENVEYAVNKTALSLNTGYDDLLPINCHGIFKLNKQSQIVIPVIVQFSESSCAVQVEFINGIPQTPDKRKLDVPDRAEPRPRYYKPDDLSDRQIQALDSQHFSRYDDETLFLTGDRSDPNSYWKLFATMAASIVFMLVGIGYFLVTKLKPAVLGRIKPTTMSFSNPNIELNNNPTQDSETDPHAASNQVIFSSGGVIFKNVQDDQHGFSNRVYEQSL